MERGDDAAMNDVHPRSVALFLLVALLGLILGVIVR